MRDSLRHFVAEFVGTFALVFLGGATIMVSKIPNSGVGPLDIALAHGLTIAVLMTALMRVSGHFNPAVTLSFAATRRIGPIMAGIYVVAQLLGAMVAAYALKGLFPAELVTATRAGGQIVSPDISMQAAIGLEAIATFVLVFVVFGTAVDPHAPKVGGFGVGMAVAVGTLALGPLTGGSMNPARSLGPAVATGIFEGQIVYWAGPLAGALVAGLLYEWLFLHRGIEPVDHGPVSPKG